MQLKTSYLTDVSLLIQVVAHNLDAIEVGKKAGSGNPQLSTYSTWDICKLIIDWHYSRSSSHILHLQHQT